MTSLTSLAAESEVQALRFALRFSPPTLVLEYKRGSDGKKRVSKFQLRKLKSSSVSDGCDGDCLLLKLALAASAVAQFLSSFFLPVPEHGRRLVLRPAAVYECERCRASHRLLCYPLAPPHMLTRAPTHQHYLKLTDR